MARFAWMLSMAVGFLSLSQEILWVRVMSFLTRGLSQSFALVLFLFLLGIAFGSAVGKRLCERRGDLLRTSAIVLGAAAVVDLLLLAVLPILLRDPGLPGAAKLAAVLPMIVLTAGLKSVMFPIAHHLGSQQSGARIGRSVSKVYFGNIAGSTLGPIVTGYILLERLTMDECLLLVGLSTGVLSLLCAVQGRTLRTGLVALAGIVPAAVLAWPRSEGIAAAYASGHADAWEHGSRVNHLIENRHGIVHTLAQRDGTPDVVLGGNIYDGRVAVDMEANLNELDRALVMLGAHPRPERVLVIGLSGGAWVRILSASPRIRQITVVEINPAYVRLIAQYPQVAGLLSDPRVHIVIDDGRRWMRRNPAEKFDLIVQNTTFSWRAYSSNLLSREYMQLSRSHLRPGGIAGFNSTGSADVLRTAQAVFPFVQRRRSFVYGSDADFSKATAEAREAYGELRLDGNAVFHESAFRPGGLARDLIDSPFLPADRQYEGLSPAPDIITDQNLLSEQAHGLYRTHLPALAAKVDSIRAALRNGRASP